MMSVFSACSNGSSSSYVPASPERLVDTIRVEKSEVLCLVTAKDTLITGYAMRVTLREKLHYGNRDIEISTKVKPWCVFFLLVEDKNGVYIYDPHRLTVNTLATAYVFDKGVGYEAKVTLKKEGQMKLVDTTHVQESVTWSFKTKDKTYTHKGNIVSEFRFN